MGYCISKGGEESSQPNSVMKLLQVILFRVSERLRTWCYWLGMLPARMAGLKVGKGSELQFPRLTWPHQVHVGRGCLIENRTSIRYYGPWEPGPSIIIEDNVYIAPGVEINASTGIRIGEGTLIAAGCKLVDHDHGTSTTAGPIRLQQPEEGEIQIGADVWLGFNVVVLKGVTIGKGAIVAAGAVVTESIPELEIWGGIPAQKIGNRI